MAIIGQNALLNQYVPTFYIKDLLDGQTLKFDSTRKAFVNATPTGGSGGVDKLGELLNVSPTVDSPNPSLHNGQGLVYNVFTSLWENTFVDYNTLLNKPTSSSFSFVGLSDTAKPSLPNGYALWNSAGTQLVYSATIPASSITGLSNGSVTTVSVVTANGVSGSVSNPTTTPAITLTLGAITPTSVAASGTISGSNLSGVNTGDQTITSLLPPQAGQAGKFLTTNGSTISWGTDVGPGTVTSVSGTGTVSGLTLSGTVTTAGSLTLGGTLSITSGQVTTALGFTPYSNANPAGYTSNTGTVTSVGGTGTVSGLTLSGSITTAGSLTLGGTLSLTSGEIVAGLGFTPYSAANPSGYTSNTGTVTSITATGSSDITISGSPITTSGTLGFALSDTTVVAGVYTAANITIDAKGRITAAASGSGGGGGTVTSVGGTGTVSGLTLSGSVTTAGSLTLGGTLSLTSGEIVAGLGFTPYSAANPSGYTTNTGTVTSITAGTGLSGGTITSTGTVSLANTAVVAGAYTLASITVDAQGRITSASNGSAGLGTVTSVSGTGTVSGLTLTGSVTTTGSLTLGGTLSLTSGEIVAGLGFTPYSNANPAGYTTNTGTVTSVGLTGSADVTVTGTTPITTSGAFSLTLSNTTVAANTYGSSTQVPVFTVDAKGRITGVTNTNISAGGSGTVTSVAALTLGTTGTDVSSTVANSTTTPVITLNIPTASASNRGALSSSDWTTFNNKTSNTGTVTSVGGTGTVSGLTLTGSVTTTGNLTLGGTLSLTSGNVTGALGFTPYSNANPAGYTSNAGTVTSITAGTGLTGGAITTSGTIALGTTAVAVGSYTLASITVDAYGRITSASNGSAGAGSVTNVSVTTTTDISGTVATSSTTPAISLSLTTTGVSLGTYGSSTQVPQFTVDAKGRISNVTNVSISGGSSSATETVIWHYSSGGAGNFTAGDAIYSNTSGVTPVVTDGTNCIASYTFTGKTTPPSSITLYGQSYGTNVFNVKTVTSLPSAIMTGGPLSGTGGPALPYLVTGPIGAATPLSLQTRFQDVGASAGLGQRAWLIIIFGF